MKFWWGHIWASFDNEDSIIWLKCWPEFRVIQSGLYLKILPISQNLSDFFLPNFYFYFYYILLYLSWRIKKIFILLLNLKVPSSAKQFKPCFCIIVYTFFWIEKKIQNNKKVHCSTYFDCSPDLPQLARNHTIFFEGTSFHENNYLNRKVSVKIETCVTLKILKEIELFFFSKVEQYKINRKKVKSIAIQFLIYFNY